MYTKGKNSAKNLYTEPRPSIVNSTATDYITLMENAIFHDKNAPKTPSILPEFSITHIDELVINETTAPLAQADSLKDELLNLNIGKPARRNSDTVVTLLNSEASPEEDHSYLMNLSDKINALKEKINFKERRRI
jgi:hypothetical protein